MNSSEQAPASREEMLSALFANMVLSQSNIALMMLGKVPHPQTGETLRDFESARMFIDQLEMLEAKTRGNLNKHEQSLLTQSLTNLRMAFVEAVEHPGSKTPTAAAPISSAQKTELGAPEKPAAEPPVGTDETDDSRKKYSKKY